MQQAGQFVLKERKPSSGISGYIEITLIFLFFLLIRNYCLRCLGGSFGVAGPSAAHGVARFDGNAWSSLGDGVDNEQRAKLQALQYVYLMQRLMDEKTGG